MRLRQQDEDADNPTIIRDVMQDILHYYQKLTCKWFSGTATHPFYGLLDMFRLCCSYQRVVWQACFEIFTTTHNYNQYWQWQQQFNELLLAIYQQSTTGEVATVIAPATQDRRFKHKLWRESPWFNLLKQLHLLMSQAAQQLTADVTGLLPLEHRQAKLYCRLFFETMSPSNFLLTNPEVLQLTERQAGLNLLKGYRNYLEDLDLWAGYINIKKSKLDAFKLGVDIAATPGKVIFQNELIQLIQYSPSTTEVWQTPLLLVTSWINKYYLLDLRTSHSLVSYAVSQGFTVFAVSWINPSVALADRGFDDYVLDGVLAAMNAVSAATGESQINVLGVCLGGTLLSAALAYLTNTQVHRVKSATLLASLIDFSDPGPIACFSNQEQVLFFENVMQATQLWDGRKMVNAFNFVRSQDFIWPYFINQYLRGNQPLPLDSLYWSQDLTNTPPPLYRFYLHALLRGNQLIKGEVKLADVPLQFSKINTPCYLVAMENDHISPWQSMYNTTQVLTGEQRFILVKAGHVAGILNPPTINKYAYWKNAHSHAQTAEDWLAAATLQTGSWWPDWCEWLCQHSGHKIPAREIVATILEAAPGSYARVTIFDLLP